MWLLPSFPIVRLFLGPLAPLVRTHHSRYSSSFSNHFFQWLVFPDYFLVILVLSSLTFISACLFEPPTGCESLFPVTSGLFISPAAFRARHLCHTAPHFCCIVLCPAPYSSRARSWFCSRIYLFTVCRIFPQLLLRCSFLCLHSLSPQLKLQPL